MTCSLFLLMCWCILSDSSHWVVHPHIAFGRSVAPDTDAARRDPEAFMDALCQVILRDRRYRRWTNYSTWTTLSPAPPKFQSCFLLPRQNKSNPTAWHVTRTRCLTLTFGEGASSNPFLEVWIICPSTVSLGNLIYLAGNYPLSVRKTFTFMVSLSMLCWITRELN